MDQLDKAILLDLSQNCRISYSSLAKKYQISVNTIKNRVNNLQAQTIISGYVVQLNPKLFNASRAIVTFRVDKPVGDEVIEQLGSHRLIEGAGIGFEAGFVIILYQNNEDLDKVMDFFANVLDLVNIEVFPISPPLQDLDIAPLKPLEALQPIDFLILYHLRTRGRIPLSSLSKRTKIPVSTIRKRLDFMRKNNMIIETILLNPGALQKGFITMFKVEVDSIITSQFRREIDQLFLKELGEYYWITWKVVDRPLLLLGFQVGNANDVALIQKKIITKLIPTYKSISHLSGGKINYFPDFRDELLEEKRNMEWFYPDQWIREE